jgi:hypothetical protein
MLSLLLECIPRHSLKTDRIAAPCSTAAAILLLLVQLALLLLLLPLLWRSSSLQQVYAHRALLTSPSWLICCLMCTLP